MIPLELYERESWYLIHEAMHQFTQAGIYMDRIEPNSVIIETMLRKTGACISDVHLRLTHFFSWIEVFIRNKRIKDSRLNEILEHYKKVANLFLNYLHTINSIDSDNFLSDFKNNKQKLKDDYTVLDYQFEEEHLREDLEEIEEIILATEIVLKEMKKLLAGIHIELKKSYNRFDKKKLIGIIDLYTNKLIELDKTIFNQEIKTKILGEIATWKEMKKKIRTVYSNEYPQFVAAMQALLKDDLKIFVAIEAAA